MTSVRTFQSAWSSCSDQAARCALLAQVAPSVWAAWAQSTPHAIDSSCVAAILADSMHLPKEQSLAWALACLGAFPGPQLAVWGGTLSTALQAPCQVALQAATGNAQGEDELALRDAALRLHWQVDTARILTEAHSRNTWLHLPLGQ